MTKQAVEVYPLEQLRMTCGRLAVEAGIPQDRVIIVYRSAAACGLVVHRAIFAAAAPSNQIDVFAEVTLPLAVRERERGFINLYRPGDASHAMLNSGAPECLRRLYENHLRWSENRKRHASGPFASAVV